VPAVTREDLGAFLRTGARPLASVRAVRGGNLRRAFRRHWARRIRIGLAVLAWWVVGTVAACAAWLAWGPAVGVVLLGVVYGPFLLEAVRLRWRARPHRGAGDGLPPGRIGVGPETLLRFDYFSDQIRAYGPISKSNYFLDPLVCIANLELATAWFREHAEHLEHRSLPYNKHVPGGAIRWAPEPRHSELRRNFSRALSSKVIEAWEPEMSRAIRAQLDDAARECASNAAGIAPRDWVREAARQVWSGLFLGLGADDPAYPEVREHMFALDICRPYPVSDAETTQRLDRMSELVRDRLAHRSPADRPTLAAELDRMEPGVLGDVGYVRNLVYLSMGTRDDTTGLLVWLLWYLAAHPDWRAKVAAAPDSDLAERVVSETLRLDQSEYVMRATRAPVPIGDYSVPENWMVRVCIREIHRDANTFPDPLRFDPDRFHNGAIGRDKYAPFGIDHRSCTGESLTRTMATAFVRELATGFDVDVVHDAPRELSWNGHWAPAETYRVRLRPRDSVAR